MAGKERVDTLLVARGLAESKARAQALIMAGLVHSDHARLDKPGQKIPDDTPLTVSGTDHPWVSRGGLKLDHALKRFSIAVEDAVALDIGASTGGFTDVLLTHGAAHVYAVDVGHGQLAWKLRQDPRVIVLERTNARYLTTEQIPRPVNLVVCDASFIGLRTVLPAPLALTARQAMLVTLIKPQFEAGREQVSKGGVVRDPSVHQEVCAMIQEWVNAQPGWHVEDITESPVLGPEGNREFLLFARKNA